MGVRRTVCIERKKHKNAYYRFRNTAISLKSARLSFIKRKQILMYFYTPAAVFVAPTPPPPPPPPPTPPTPATAGAVRGVEAKSNYFYSGEMSAAKSLILINGAGTRSPLPLSFSSPPFDTHHSTTYHSSPSPFPPMSLSPSLVVGEVVGVRALRRWVLARSRASSTRITHNSNASK